MGYNLSLNWGDNFMKYCKKKMDIKWPKLRPKKGWPKLGWYRSRGIIFYTNFFNTKFSQNIWFFFLKNWCKKYNPTGQKHKKLACSNFAVSDRYHPNESLKQWQQTSSAPTSTCCCEEQTKIWTRFFYAYFKNRITF